MYIEIVARKNIKYQASVHGVSKRDARAFVRDNWQRGYIFLGKASGDISETVGYTTPKLREQLRKLNEEMR